MRILEQNRSAYKRTYRQKDHCDFCDPKVIQDQQIKRLEGKFWQVLACKYPYMNGNLMLVPKRHITQLEKVSPDEWSDLQVVLLQTQKILGRMFKTKSYNLAMNLGPYSGGTIPHLHLMIVPRPKKINPAAFNVFHDFYLVQMDYKQLQKKLAEL